MERTINNTSDYATYDRQKELKAFDDTKLGVKGLVDSGITTLPRIFIRPPNELVEEFNTPTLKLQVPVIDFEGIHPNDRYQEIVGQVREASSSWGFFQVVNHGIPVNVLDDMIKGIKMFNEDEDVEKKKRLYNRDQGKQVGFQSNYDLFYSRTANWRDTFKVDTSNFSGFLDPNEIPEICSGTWTEARMPDYLKEMECNKGWTIVGHYYPACPAPDLTLGTTKHTDPSFLTMLLQDQIGGLQVFYQNQWVHVQPIPGAIVVNIGDFLQIMSNDKFKSVFHRVVANDVGPRISVAMLLKGVLSSPRSYGPIKELLSEESPALYREFNIPSYFSRFFSRGLHAVGFDFLKSNNLENDM